MQSPIKSSLLPLTLSAVCFPPRALCLHNGKLSERGEHAVVELKYGMLQTQTQPEHCKYNPLVH